MGKWDGHPGVMVDGGITHGLGLKTEKKKKKPKKQESRPIPSFTL